jgi:hypothetical protein
MFACSSSGTDAGPGQSSSGASGAGGTGEAVSGAGNSQSGSGQLAAGGAGAGGSSAGAAFGGTNSAGASAGGSGGVSAGGSGGGAFGGTAAAGTSGSAGSAGSAQAGSGGASTDTGTGLAVLTVPLAAASDTAHFVITLANTIDMSAATITFHVNVPAGTSGVFQAYIQHGGTPDYAQLFQGWQTLSSLSGWQDIVWDVASTANPNTVDETIVGRLGIEIAGGSVDSFSATTDVVYVDSIRVSAATPASGPWTFDSDASIAATTYPASDILWLNTASTDTSATGATLTWLSAP